MHSGRSNWKAAALGIALFAIAQRQSVAATIYSQIDLTSDVPGLAANTDPNLKNPWGMSFSATSPFWVSNEMGGTATLYNGAGVPNSLVVTIPGSTASTGPTGQVFASVAGNFLLNGNPAAFIFDTLGGNIDAWNGGSTATIVQSVAGVQYTGLALANNGTGNFLYAANHTTGKIDVFDSSFTPVTLSGTFSDPTIPTGYVPYNIQNFNERLYVEYVLKGASGNPLAPQRGAGNGFVRVYDPNGNLVSGAPAISGGNLNAPWGVAFAPASFGDFSGDLLVGNFGNGMINAYDPATGAFVGTILGPNGQPLVNNNLWAIATRVGTGFNAGAVYFDAGINAQNDGLLGEIAPTPEPGMFWPGCAALVLLTCHRAARRGLSL